MNDLFLAHVVTYKIDKVGIGEVTASFINSWLQTYVSIKYTKGSGFIKS